MSRQLVPSTLIVIACVLPIGAQQPKEDDSKGPRWSCLSINISKGKFPGDLQSSFDRRTRLEFMLEVPGASIVRIVDTRCNLDSFTDDKNTDFLADSGDEKVRMPHLSQGLPGVSADGKYAMVTVHAGIPPAAGATRLRIKGTVTVMVGKNEKDIEKKDVSLQKGVELEFGTLKSKAPFGGVLGDNPIGEGFGKKGGAGFRLPDNVEYKGNRPLKRVTATDGDGKEIIFRQQTLHRSGRKTGEDVYTIFLTRPFTGFPKNAPPLDRCTLRITYYDTVEEITVPMKVEAGLGL